LCEKKQLVLVWVRFSYLITQFNAIYILSSEQSSPRLVPTYDITDRPYDRRQTYKDPTYVHFSRTF